MTRTTYHVIPAGKAWRVIRAGAGRAAGVFDKKPPAIALAKALVKNARLGQVKVHGSNGEIQTEYTYGKDSGERLADPGVF